MEKNTYVDKRFMTEPPSNGNWFDFIVGVWDVMKNMAKTPNPFVAAAMFLIFPIIAALMSKSIGLPNSYIWIVAGLSSFLGGWVGWKAGSAMMVAGFLILSMSAVIGALGLLTLIVMSIIRL